jgi:hypothetical protein
MGVSRYNRVFNLSLAVIVIYNIICLASVVLSIEILDSIVSKSAIIYLIYAIGTLCYKIHLTRYFFLGSYAVKNLVAHGVLTGLSMFLIITVVF